VTDRTECVQGRQATDRVSRDWLLCYFTESRTALGAVGQYSMGVRFPKKLPKSDKLRTIVGRETGDGWEKSLHANSETIV
jgi:hypothetical protein